MTRGEKSGRPSTGINRRFIIFFLKPVIAQKKVTQEGLCQEKQGEGRYGLMVRVLSSGDRICGLKTLPPRQSGFFLLTFSSASFFFLSFSPHCVHSLSHAQCLMPHAPAFLTCHRGGQKERNHINPSSAIFEANTDTGAKHGRGGEEKNLLQLQPIGIQNAVLT